MQFATGSYTGNGIVNRWITIGFQPGLVIIKANASQHAVFHTSAMPSDQTCLFAGDAALFSNAIQAFSTSGFQIGTHSTVNQSGITYYWSAFRDNGAGDFAVGVYTGDGIDDRNVDVVGFQPTVLWIKGDLASSAVWRVEENDAGSSMGFRFTAKALNQIQSFRPLGFQIGTSSTINSDQIWYYYVAFKDVADFIETGSYVGNGVVRYVPGLNFIPDMVFVKSDTAAYSVLRIDTMGGQNSAPHGPVTPAPNQIIAFAANSFAVGTHNRVNRVEITYHWAAWKSGEVGATTTTTTTTTTLSTTSTTWTVTLSTTSTSTSTSTSTTTVSTTSTLSTTLTTTTLPFTPVPGTSPVLRICDKDGCINLLKRGKQSGYRLCGWTPRIADYKRGGIWQDSPIAEGRRLAQRRFGNVAETMTLTMSGHNLETLIREGQDLRRLMEKASNYWWADWQNDPVWIEARAKCETNVRYAILHRGKILRDPNPYSQPFMERHYGRTAARNLNLILERGHWMSLPPERSGSILASVRECYCWPSHLEFDGDTSNVNCGNPAGLNELHDAALTVEMWIRADGWGGGDQAELLNKELWYFRLESGMGLEARILCAVAAGAAGSTAGDFVPDGEWHHVAMTWDDATYLHPRLWIDGIEPGYSFTINRNGAVLADSAYFLYIGNRDAGGRSFDGGFGWVRVSDTIRYAANFTPPARCTLPAIDANTVGQWIGAESSGTTIANQEGTAARDGTQTDCLFACACDERCYGNVDLTQARQPIADHIYVANRHSEANITHIFRYDAAPPGFSGNLVGTAPFDLLPAVPAVGDMVYFGCPGPFSSLVFDLEDAHFDIASIVWEYWNGGAWVTLTITRDNTRDWFGITFGQLGTNSVVWGQPNDWAMTLIGLLNGYWVRARVTGVGATPTPPRQQNRDVYTVVWPYLEVDNGDIAGDIVALALFKQVSAGFEVDNVVVGLRSLGRGSEFSAYLNCADEQLPTGVSVAVSGNCAFGDTLSTGSGREVLYTAGANGAIEIRLGSTVGSHYYGVYHAYLRGLQDGGYEGDTTFTISIELGSGQVVQEQLTGFEFEPDVDWFLVDIGRLEISPPALLDSNESYDENKVIVDIGGTQNVHFYGLILIPIDEWAARFTDLEQGASSTNRLKPGRLLEFESVRHPKQQLRANLWSRQSQRIVGHWDRQANGPAILQANASQRLWVLVSLGNVSRPEVLTWFSVEAVQRYLSMRGDR